MGDKTEIDNSFDLCAVKLWNLPSQFKKWQTLGWYRIFWNFVNKASIRENICESRWRCTNYDVTQKDSVEFELFPVKTFLMLKRSKLKP
jgi:hypothetical protein